MKLSIITINYNNKDGLQRTIDSVSIQTFKDFEWIIVDGGSTDGSQSIIKQHSNYFSYFCCEPDLGIYNAMNKGILKAKGEYITFLNSGDYYVANNTLEKIFLNIDKRADVYYGNPIILEDNRNYLKQEPADLLFIHLMHNTINHQSSFIKRSLFENNLYDEHLQIVSDWKWFVLAFISGRKFVHIDCEVVFYDIKGISSNNSKLLNDEKSFVMLELDNNKIFKYYKDVYFGNLFSCQRFPCLSQVLDELVRLRINRHIIRSIILALHIIAKLRKFLKNY